MENSLHKLINNLYDEPLTLEEVNEAENNLVAYMQELINIDLKLKGENKEEC